MIRIFFSVFLSWISKAKLSSCLFRELQNKLVYLTEYTSNIQSCWIMISFLITIVQEWLLLSKRNSLHQCLHIYIIAIVAWCCSASVACSQPHCWRITACVSFPVKNEKKIRLLKNGRVNGKRVNDRMTPGDSRWLQRTPDDSRWLQTTSGNSRWPRTTPDDSRWPRTTSDSKN